MRIEFIIAGEPASKANSRQLVTIRGKIAFIKSKKALGFEREAGLQIPHKCRAMFEGPVAVTLHLYYASERPDLDESVVLDVLQAQYKIIGGKRELVRAGVYLNDRQVREKHVYHHIDKANPRVHVVVVPIYPKVEPPVVTPILFDRIEP